MVKKIFQTKDTVKKGEIIRKFVPGNAIKAVDGKPGVYEAWISTESVDRDGDIVVASGADITNFEKNPVVLFGHRYGDPNAVVGKAESIDIVEGKGIKARWSFASDLSENAALVERLWAGEFLNATSIGFRILEYENMEEQVEDDNGDTRTIVTGWKFLEWELLEFSVVPVPANQEALRREFEELELVKGLNYIGPALDNGVIRTVGGEMLETETLLLLAGLDNPEGTVVLSSTCTGCGSDYSVSATLASNIVGGSALQLCETCTADPLSEFVRAQISAEVDSLDPEILENSIFGDDDIHPHTEPEAIDLENLLDQTHQLVNSLTKEKD